MHLWKDSNPTRLPSGLFQSLPREQPESGRFHSTPGRDPRNAPVSPPIQPVAIPEAATPHVALLYVQLTWLGSMLA